MQLAEGVRGALGDALVASLRKLLGVLWGLGWIEAARHHR